MHFLWLCRQPPSRPVQNHEKMVTVLYISYDSVANRTPPTDFQSHENDDSLIRSLWFWSQPPPSGPLQKAWKWWLSNAFLMILEPFAPLPPTSTTLWPWSDYLWNRLCSEFVLCKVLCSGLCGVCAGVFGYVGDLSDISIKWGTKQNHWPI